MEASEAVREAKLSEGFRRHVLKHSYSVILCCENVAATILQISIAPPARLFWQWEHKSGGISLIRLAHQSMNSMNPENGKLAQCHPPELRWFWVKIKYPKTNVLV